MKKTLPIIVTAGKDGEDSNYLVEDTVEEEVEDNDDTPKKKKDQTNWGKESNCGKLEKAVNDYLDKTGNTRSYIGGEI